MIKDSPTWERGHIEHFHLITHPNARLPPPLPLLPVTNHTSFSVSRGQNGEQPAPLCETPWWDNPGDSEYQQGRRRRDIARRVKGKRVEWIFAVDIAR